MLIDRFRVQNYMGYKAQEFALHPQFNLFCGENGAGKTSLLESLADALGIWHSVIKDYGLRNLKAGTVRLEWVGSNGSKTLERQYPMTVQVLRGKIAGQPQTWSRDYDARSTTTNKATQTTRKVISQIVAAARNGEPVVLPLLAYYGDGRLHLDRQVRAARGENDDSRRIKNSLSRLEGNRNSLDSRIAWKAWVQWVAKQEWTAFQEKSEPIAYNLFKQAVLSCIEGAESFRYDAKKEEILVGIHRQGELPLEQLSAGQKSMVLMIGDIARRVVQLNDHLGAECLKRTPGIVLIDELDLHLHPIWQRTIPHSLKKTFESIQFICTSHSPQIIGELPPEEVQFLSPGKSEHPGQSFGLDSNWILNVLMGGLDKNSDVEAGLERIKDQLMQKDYEGASATLQQLRSQVGNSGAIQRAASSIERFKLLEK